MKKFELVLIEDWRKCWKLYSVWFFAILMAAPELYNAAISAGLLSQEQVPGLFSKLMSLVSFLGLVSRVVAQKQKTINDLSPEDQAKVALGLETVDEATAAANATKPLAEVVISESAPVATPAAPAAPPAGQ